MPSLVKAYRIQDKARAVGFDWQERSQVWEKVREEIGEFEDELKKGEEAGVEGGSGNRAEQEFGDLLFSLVNAARLYKINPDTALEQTNKKFISRFNYLEQKVKAKGMNLKDMTLEQMDILWNEAKGQNNG